MTVSLTLFISASAFVRLFSVPLAVAMCVIAAIIPPIAAFSANRWDSDDHWWDEPAPGEGVKDTRDQDARPKDAQGPKDAEDRDESQPMPPSQDHPRPPPSRSTDDRSLDELLWEEELRGYNGERFGHDP